MRLAAAILCATGVAAVAACQGNSNPASGEPGPGDYPFSVARATDVQRQTGAVDGGLLREQAASNNRFAVAVYQRLVREDENLFFSPFSVQAALGMAAAGARGQTEAQMRAALQATLPGEDLHRALNGLELDLERHVGGVDGIELNIVNAVWAQRDFDFQAAFLELLARAYGAGVNLLDFAAAPDPSRLVINSWVSEQTRQRIEELLPPGSISADTRLVLTNAVYFLGRWLYRFDRDGTQDEPFHRLDGSTVAAPLMRLGEPGQKLELEYARDPAAAVRAINLYYCGERLCMTVLLPDPGAFVAYERALDAAAIESLLARLQPTELPPVRLPRFTYTSASLSLNEPLQALGMLDAFVPEAADFSGVDGRRDLFVSQVLHKAFVAVDEQGTEAAAATAVAFEATAVPTDPPQFIADRPFVFLVRDTETGLILFMGRLVDPTRSQ